MPKLTSKIKTHFQDHKQFYIGAAIGAGVAIVGAAAYVLVKGTGHHNQTANIIGANNTVEFLSVHIEALGDPGNIIQDLTTGTIYASQAQAARELGVLPQRISDQVNGRAPHIKGHKFAVLGKAPVGE